MVRGGRIPRPHGRSFGCIAPPERVGICSSWFKIHILIDCSDPLEILSLEIFDENLFLRLDLKKFEEETYEFRWTLVAVDASDVF